MSTSQANKATEAIDTPISLANFQKNWVSGRYRNLLEWGTTSAGTRVTAELKEFDKRGRATGQWRPLSLLITDLTTKNVQVTDLPFANTVTTTQFATVGSQAVQLLPGPPAGKTNWGRIIINSLGGPSIPAAIVVLADKSINSNTSAGGFVIPPWYPFSGASVQAFPRPFVTNNFAGSIWGLVSVFLPSAGAISTVTVGVWAQA